MIFFLRHRLGGLPFERDEGEFSYFGQLILQGIMPYEMAYNMKLPGTYFMYALIIKIFGASPEGVHLGVTFVILLTMYLFYQIVTALFSKNTALLAILLYGVIVSSKATLGAAGHATHFINLFVFAGIYSWLKWKNNQNWLYVLLIGIMMGMAFLMKQHAVFFIPMGLALILFHLYHSKTWSIKNILTIGAIYTIGVFIPYIIVLLTMLTTGNFDNFWFWTVEYAQKYGTSIITLGQAPEIFMYNFKILWKEFPLLWLSGLGGLIIILQSKMDQSLKLFLILFFAFGFLTICPGLYFRQHYFITWIPSIILLAVTLHQWIANKIFNEESDAFSYTFAIAAIPLIVVIMSFSKNKPYWFTKPLSTLSKEIYGSNPFIESEEIGRYINKNTTKDQKIAILGSEPQIMVYADRLSATGYIYTYGMMEPHAYNVKMQEEMISEIEKNKPEIIVFVKVGLSWSERPDSPRKIFEWMPKYVDSRYDVVGLVEIYGDKKGEYYWDDAAKGKQPQSDQHLVVFKKKK